MKKNDALFWGALLALLLPFVFCDFLYEAFLSMTAEHKYLMGFVKFAILSTMGEMLGLRIRKGVYTEKGFGLAARALVWGVLGVGITLAMAVFGKGAPAAFDQMLGFDGRLLAAMGGDFSGLKVLGAFTISLMMNSIFAPVFMTMHKITDTHIVLTGGSLSGFFGRRIDFSHILQNLNWKVQWHFVFMKTIPFFWIPAHTLTFVLPAEFQVLFAALLGVILGVILSMAANK